MIIVASWSLSMKNSNRKMMAEMILAMVRKNANDKHSAMIDSYFELYYNGMDKFIESIKKEKELWNIN
jgi:hypothetical protein|tara:strand:+ start:2123 stop:2326 length:204 start_codon:yes stop_codon:yes gene_type:complete